MPSGITFDAESHHFQAKYEHPWGGVASDAAPMDIQPNQFEQCDGVISKDGVLNAACIDFVNAFGYIGDFLLAQVFNINDAVYFLTANGNIYGSLAGQPNNLFPDISAPIASNANCTDASCVQIINSLAYIFSQGVVPGVYVFDPTVPSFVLGSNFVAGLYCCTVDQYLITANSLQPTDTPPYKTGRVSWSSPDGFTTWDPAVDRTAGFNVLTDVSDYIANLFAMGNVAYVLRSQGLTQMTPTGVGIAPFDFTSLWASDHGIGCTFPNTFAQYGYIAAWMNDTDIFVFSGGGIPQGIGGAARSAIYRDIFANDQNNPNVRLPVFVGGCIHNNNITITGTGGVNSKTSTPNLEYSLFIVTLNHQGTNPFTTSYDIINWAYNLQQKTWTRLVKNIVIPGVNGSTYLTCRIATAVYGTFTFTALNSSFPIAVARLVPVLCINDSQSTRQFILSRYQADIKYPANAITTLPAVTLKFKQEEIVLTKQPEVRGVAIKAVGIGTLNVHITGNINPTKNAPAPTLIDKTFTPVTINSTTPITLYSSGTFTGEDPQCTITGNSFDGVIIKAAMFGTYADGEPF